MPSMPSTIMQLGMLLLFLLPGVVFQSTRGRLTGPTLDDASPVGRVVRALAVSAGLTMVYALAIGPYVLRRLEVIQGPNPLQAFSTTIRELALLALVLLILVPALAAWVWKAIEGPVAPRLALSYSPVPRAWDFAFTRVGPQFVRVLTTDGRYLGGWFAEGSYASSYPEPREIFLSCAYHMSPDGQFLDLVSGSNGIYIRCDDVRAVELLDVGTDVPHPGS